MVEIGVKHKNIVKAKNLYVEAADFKRGMEFLKE